MAQGKKKIIIYTDWREQFKDLTDEEAGKLIKHFFDYVNDLNPQSDRLIELLFNPIKATLKRDLKSWENKAEINRQNGLKGGRPKTQNNPNNPNGFIETHDNPKKGVSVSDSVNVNDNVINKEKINKKESIDIRKNKFYDSLVPFVDKYSKEMLKDFFIYWSEHGEKDIKMRFEKEKTFGVEARLRTWYNRNPNQYKLVEEKPKFRAPWD